MGSFSQYVNVFLFETGFRLGEDEEGDRDTRHITLETKGVAAFMDSLRDSSQTSVPQSSSQGRSTGHLPAQSWSGALCRTAATDLSMHVRGVLNPPKGAVNVATIAKSFTSWYCAIVTRTTTVPYWTTQGTTWSKNVCSEDQGVDRCGKDGEE